MKKKKKDNKKTLSTCYSITKEQTSVFRFLTNESKKIYNHYMFYLNIYNYYKNNVYNDIFIMHTDKKITNDNIDEHVVNRFKYYSLIYINNYEQFKINNKLIYNIIKNMNLIITDTNYYQSYLQIINKCLLNKDIIFNSSNCDFLFYDIIKNILTTFYINNFYSVRYQLLNNIPIKEHLNIASFIEHVKLGQLRYSNNILLTPKYYTALSEIYDINSEQTIIRKFALYNLNDCKIYKDTVINIMDSVYDSYKSFLALKFSGKYANKPKFKLDNEKYILPLYSKSFTIIKNRIRVCLGNYVDRHYNEICKTDYKIIKQNKIYTLYESEKENFKGSFTYINLPKQLKDKKITLIHIVPLYDGYKFKINFIYENKPIEREYNKEENISIDLGMDNLMTIYDPLGEQYIIKGGKLIYMNEQYNNKINYLKSKMNKNGHTISNRIRDLLIKRENKIDNCFNQITNKIYELYNKKDKIIIGYNESWKTNINLGKNINRKFYQIPFRKLIKTLKNKFGENIIEINESYTSKTDSLAKEEICKHETYLGKRISRSLFSSSKKKLLNADLNGTINIMRKYEMKYNNRDIEEIKGITICNPKKISAYEV
jgi:IS605 OrfB family transposase